MRRKYCHNIAAQMDSKCGFFTNSKYTEIFETVVKIMYPQAICYDLLARSQWERNMSWLSIWTWKYVETVLKLSQVIWVTQNLPFLTINFKRFNLTLSSNLNFQVSLFKHRVRNNFILIKCFLEMFDTLLKDLSN